MECSRESTLVRMTDPFKIPWPSTYLGRLQTVTMLLRNTGVPTSVESLVERFDGVIPEQIEAILTALVLYGRVEKQASLYFVPEQT